MVSQLCICGHLETEHAHIPAKLNERIVCDAKIQIKEYCNCESCDGHGPKYCECRMFRLAIAQIGGDKCL